MVFWCGSGRWLGGPRTPRQHHPVESVGPTLVMFAPSHAAVPSLFDGDLGCLFQTGEAFYKSTIISNI